MFNVWAEPGQETFLSKWICVIHMYTRHPLLTGEVGLYVVRISPSTTKGKLYILSKDDLIIKLMLSDVFAIDEGKYSY